MSDLDHVSHDRGRAGSLRFACLSWTPIPAGWALMVVATPGSVLETNLALALLGFFTAAAGVATATAGLLIAIRAARRRHPGHRGAIAFALAGNAVALGTVIVSIAPAASHGPHGPWHPDLAGPVRRPIADRQVTLADRLLAPGTGVVWSGRRRPSAVAWRDGTVAALVGANGLAAMTAAGTELWRRPLVRRPTPGNCLVRGLAIDAAGDAVSSCGATVAAVAEDGSDVWRRRFDGYVVRGLVCDAAGRIYLYAEPRTGASIVIALSSGGAVRWRGSIRRLGAIRRYTQPSQSLISAATPAQGGGVVVATDGRIIDLAADGSRRWRLSSGEEPVEVDALLTGRDGTIYVGGSSEQGFVQAISPDGSPRWAATTGGPAVQALGLGRDGTLYAVTWADLLEFSTGD